MAYGLKASSCDPLNMLKHVSCSTIQYCPQKILNFPCRGLSKYNENKAASWIKIRAWAAKRQMRRLIVLSTSVGCVLTVLLSTKIITTRDYHTTIIQGKVFPFDLRKEQLDDSLRHYKIKILLRPTNKGHTRYRKASNGHLQGMILLMLTFNLRQKYRSVNHKMVSKILVGLLLQIIIYFNFKFWSFVKTRIECWYNIAHRNHPLHPSLCLFIRKKITQLNYHSESYRIYYSRCNRQMRPIMVHSKIRNAKYCVG